MKATTTLGLAALLLGTAVVATAHNGPPANPPPPPIIVTVCDDVKQLDVLPVCKQILAAQQAPEIDPSSAMAGLTMLLAGLAVVRGRIRKDA